MKVSRGKSKNYIGGSLRIEWNKRQMETVLKEDRRVSGLEMEGRDRDENQLGPRSFSLKYFDFSFLELTFI